MNKFVFLLLPIGFAIFVVTTFTGCGVRGKPQPPETPAALGRGKPGFKKTSDEFAFPNVPSPDANPQPTPAPTPGSF